MDVTFTIEGRSIQVTLPPNSYIAALCRFHGDDQINVDDLSDGYNVSLVVQFLADELAINEVDDQPTFLKILNYYLEDNMQVKPQYVHSGRYKYTPTNPSVLFRRSGEWMPIGGWIAKSLLGIPYASEKYIFTGNVRFFKYNMLFDYDGPHVHVYKQLIVLPPATNTKYIELYRGETPPAIYKFNSHLTIFNGNICYPERLTLSKLKELAAEPEVEYTKAICGNILYYCGHSGHICDYCPNKVHQEYRREKKTCVEPTDWFGRPI